MMVWFVFISGILGLRNGIIHFDNKGQ